MFLKITRTTNLWITAAAILNALLIASSSLANIVHLMINLIFYQVAFYSIIILYLLLDYYLISVLVFFKERRFIITAFIIHFCVDILRNLPLFTIGRLAHIYIQETIGLLNLVTMIYMIIAAAKISKAAIAFPFRLLSISLLFIALIKAVVSILYPLINGGVDGYAIAVNLRAIMDYFDFFNLIIPVSVIILANWADRYLAKEVTQAESW